jgi:hypothetical protein
MRKHETINKFNYLFITIIRAIKKKKKRKERKKEIRKEINFVLHCSPVYYKV